MLKEKLWHEIDSLPDSRLKTLLEFVQFLQFMEDKESGPTAIFTYSWS